MKWDLVLLAMPSIFIALSIALAVFGAANAIGHNPDSSGPIVSLSIVGIACLEVMWLIISAVIFSKF